VSAAVLKEAVSSLRHLPSGRSDVWYLRGYIVFHCLYTLSRIGFVDDLAVRGSVNIDAYAKEKQLDVTTLMAIARYLFGVGILDRTNDGCYFKCVEIEEADLATLEMFYAYDPLFHNLSQLITGESTYGIDIKRFPELDAKATAQICKNFSYPKAIAEIENRGAQCVLDLGCGAAELLIQACRRNPLLRGFGIDCEPDVIEYARERIAAESLNDRIRVEVGDILDLQPEKFMTRKEVGAVDLILSAAVFHEFAFPGIRGLVEALRGVKRRFAGVELMLVEALEQSDEQLRTNPTFVLEHHLFHRLSLQGIASLKEWRYAFSEAGFKFCEEIPISPGGMIFILS
jgi:SAM-dependent methyltransferase